MSDSDDRAHQTAVEAGEYVLGTLSKPQRAAFERRLQREAPLRALVDRWQSHFMQLFYRLPPVEPPPSLWPRIEQEINRRSVNYQEGEKPMWNSIAFWRLSAMAAAAGVVALALIVLLRPGAAPFDPVKGLQEYVWVLTDGEKRPNFVVKFDKDRKRVTIVPLGQTAAGDKALQLWLVPTAASGAKAEAPRSLGLVKPASITTLDLDQGKLGLPIQAGILAVSTEPPGGSPTGAPTGPVILQGKPDPVPN